MPSAADPASAVAARSGKNSDELGAEKKEIQVLDRCLAARPLGVAYSFGSWVLFLPGSTDLCPRDVILFLGRVRGAKTIRCVGTDRPAG